MTSEHTFPLPEVEAHKLDVLRNELPAATRHNAKSMDRWIRENPKTATGAACLFGFLLAFFVHD